jgi:hypothetical protein
MNQRGKFITRKADELLGDKSPIPEGVKDWANEPMTIRTRPSMGKASPTYEPNTAESVAYAMGFKPALVSKLQRAGRVQTMMEKDLNDWAESVKNTGIEGDEKAFDANLMNWVKVKKDLDPQGLSKSLINLLRSVPKNMQKRGVDVVDQMLRDPATSTLIKRYLAPDMESETP